MSFPVITFKWRPISSWRAPYTAENVNYWARMVREHIPGAHPVCITDDPEGIECDTYPLWEHPVIKVDDSANCYVRLKMFSGWFATDFMKHFGFRSGSKFLHMDLDCVIKGDLDDLVQRDDDLVLGYGSSSRYNPSIILHRSGTRQDLYDKFNPAESPKDKGVYEYTMLQDMPDDYWMFFTGSGTDVNFGSDMAWISRMAGDVPKFTPRDGVWYYRDIRNLERWVYGHGESLTNGFEREYAKARIIFFNGYIKPWMPEIGEKIYKEYHTLTDQPILV